MISITNMKTKKFKFWAVFHLTSGYVVHLFETEPGYKKAVGDMVCIDYSTPHATFDAYILKEMGVEIDYKRLIAPERPGRRSGIQETNPIEIELKLPVDKDGDPYFPMRIYMENLQ